MSEKVRILVMDANDESPEFINTPYIVQVPEVGEVSLHNIFQQNVKRSWCVFGEVTRCVGLTRILLLWGLARVGTDLRHAI